MNTSAISSPVNLTTGNTNAARPADAEEGGASFGQVLSREMAARPKADGTDGTRHKQATRPEHGAENKEPRSSTKANESNAAEQTGNADSAKPTSAQATVDSEQDENTPSAPAAEDMLALVASLTQSTIARPEADGSSQAAGNTAAVADAEIPDAQLPALAALIAGQSGSAQESGAKAAAADPMPADGSNAGRTRAETIQTLHDRIGPGRARGGAMQSLNDRAQQDAATNDDAPGTDGLPGKASQAADARMAANDSGARAAADTAASGKAEAANLRFAAADASFAKSLQDAQPASAAPPGIGAPSAVHAQPAGVQHAQAAPGEFADRLAPRVGTPAWNQALGQKVIWMVGGEQQTASLTLNPPDLGPLQVVLTVSENQATANFTAAQPEVRQALEAALPKLREMLGEAGIQLGQADVSAGTPDNQHNAFDQQERATHGAAAPDDSAELQVRVSQVVSGGQGLVDTFA